MLGQNLPSVQASTPRSHGFPDIGRKVSLVLSSGTGVGFKEKLQVDLGLNIEVEGMQGAKQATEITLTLDLCAWAF